MGQNFFWLLSLQPAKVFVLKLQMWILWILALTSALKRFTGRLQPCQKALLTLREAIYFLFGILPSLLFWAHCKAKPVCSDSRDIQTKSRTHQKGVTGKKIVTTAEQRCRAEVIYLGCKPLRASQMAGWRLRKDTASSAKAQTPRLKHAVAGLDQFSSRMKASQVSWRVGIWKDR